jgi:hypothetical protein
MLVVAQVVTMIARPPITEQDAYNAIRDQKLEEMSRSGGNSIRVRVPPPPPPMPGHR